MSERTKRYDNFTITHIGQNEFGEVYAVYSELLEIIFADIAKSKKERGYELRIYHSTSLSCYALKEISAFIEFISESLYQKEATMDIVDKLREAEQGKPTHSSVIPRADSEIESLRAELAEAKARIAELEKFCEKTTSGEYYREQEKQIAELEKLIRNIQLATEGLLDPCKRITELEKKLAEYQNCTAGNLLKDNLRMANELSELEKKLAEANELSDWLFRCKEEWLVSTKPSMSNEGTTLTGKESEHDTIGPLRKYIYCVHGHEDNIYEGKTAIEAIKLYRAALRGEK